MAGPSRSLTSGGIFYSLARFSLPVLLTLFLQALYGGVDLLVVGQFASTADVSGVSTGSMLLSTFTMLVTGLSMGPTVTVGEAIGSGSPKEAGRAVLAGLTLLGSSFLVIQALVNSMGTTASAGVGVGEKVCTFIMLVPSAYTQSMSAFVAQNRGAGRMDRAQRALRCGILSSLVVGAVMGALTFWHGDWLAALFARDPAVVAAARQYLQAYAIDCLLTPLLFCFTGYFNGCEKTLFVMAQGIIGAFCVRIPVAWAMSRLPETSLFLIGLGTPASSLVQDLLCVGYFLLLMRKGWREAG